MDRIFETQSTGYGQFVLGIARATKAKVYRVFTALKLPRLLASALTWGVLISIGLMLAGLIAFAAFVYFMVTSKSGSDPIGQGNERGAATIYSPEYSHLGQNVHHAEYLAQVEYAENLHK